MVTLVARSVLVSTMAALCANLALLTGAKLSLTIMVGEVEAEGRQGQAHGMEVVVSRSLLQRNYLQQAEPHLRLVVQCGLLPG